MDKRKYLNLFLTFLRIGAFTFGGGYAMIPLIHREIVENKKWLKEKDMLDIIAVSESTPGPFAVNSATFVGYQVGGFIGSSLATLGVVLPSFIIIFAISFILKQFEHLEVVKYTFHGIRAGVFVLILSACYSMFRACRKDIFNYILIIFALIAVAFFNVSAILVLIICAVVGYCYTRFMNRKAE